MKKNYFRFKKIDSKYLITNDVGRYAFLDKESLYKYITDDFTNSKEDRQLIDELKENFFLYEDGELSFVEEAGFELRNYKQFLFQGTSLHIFVLTNQCNQQCIYCQASTNKVSSKKMTKETAQKSVDLALQAPGKYLTFEFQGGEPLMNFEVLKYIVEYTEEKNRTVGKNIDFTVVTNLMMINDQMLEYFKNHNIIIATSLDGDRMLHNINRPMGEVDVFAKLSLGICKIQEADIPISAIQTTTRYSLERYKEIVDQYINFGLDQVFLRPLTPLGYAGDSWNKIGYTAEEFVEFYYNAFNYIIEKNKQGIPIAEGHACLFLEKIIGHDSGNYMELRSPCGGALGQVAYYYDGIVYSCDEARMLAEMGDRSFALGTVYEDNWNDLMSSPICKTLGKASCLEGLSDCYDCVYSPYCGTCPIISYKRYETLYPKLLHEYRCTIYKGIQDIIFGLLLKGDEKEKNILESWIKRDKEETIYE